MYLEYFGLKKPPFKITPDTHLFFSGSERGASLEALMFSIQNGCGITKVIGEVGTGKTMLCHMLACCLPKHIDIVFIGNPSLSADHILAMVALELNIPVKETWNKLQIMQSLINVLLQKHATGRQVVVFIEEAQSMPTETLEEIRLMSNLETGQAKLLQIVLFGQPELDDKLKNKNIRQLKERINYSLYLKPFTAQDIYDYLNFRMRHAGYQGPGIFSKPISKMIALYSQGLARRINIIADKTLMIAFSKGRYKIKHQDVLRAVKDSDFSVPQTNSMIALAVLVVLLAYLWYGNIVSLFNLS